jgi:hypothetical protein
MNMIKQAGLVKVGDAIRFDRYEWLVLSVDDNNALIITQDAIELRPYHREDKAITWEKCDLRKYLNEEYFNSFGEKERCYIVQTKNRNQNNYWYGTDGGNDTDDYIFLLSLEEADVFFGNSGDYLSKRRKKRIDSEKSVPDDNGSVISNSSDMKRLARYGSEICWWWLRSPGYIDSGAAHIGRSGRIGVIGSSVYGCSGGVRSALLLSSQYFSKANGL